MRSKSSWHKSTQFFYLLFYCSINAQSYFALDVDNDLYFGTDRYYSSGIFLKYGKLKTQSRDSLSYWRYASSHWELGQEINTPASRLTSNPDMLDYPYNGWLYIGFKQEYLHDFNFGMGWGVELGTTGSDASFSRILQNTYHKYVLDVNELTWVAAMPQAFHLNLKGNLMYSVPLTRKISWVQNTLLRLGTFRSSARLQTGLQYGNILGFPFFGERLESINEGTALFLGGALEYRMHNYAFSGSAFRENSPLDFTFQNYQTAFQLGLVYHSLDWRILTVLHVTSLDVMEQEYPRHTYLTIKITRLF